MSPPPYSYRDNPAVPPFDDSRPVFIFDHVCVLCSGGVSFIMKHDRRGTIAFTPAQGELGSALARHFGIDWDESYIFIRNGRAFTKSDGYFEVARTLGGWWRLALAFRLIPRPLRNWMYDRIARNRYNWFGKTEEACALLTPEQRARLI
ncbi:MAG: DCC1-like thiol-disulfide oxidoreductase family protein [Erythrobacter sp.]|jgi:predicted DCC family thiol-disulfide oxidoreductase YuxK|nr:DCC1-like thiol-disulfide oxidoreductase family protein [Erythrobacter sp.]